MLLLLLYSRSKIGTRAPIRTSPHIPTQRAPPATFPGNVPTPAMLPCRRQCHPPCCRQQRRKKITKTGYPCWARIGTSPASKNTGDRRITRRRGNTLFRRPKKAPTTPLSSDQPPHGNLWESFSKPSIFFKIFCCNFLREDGGSLYRRFPTLVGLFKSDFARIVKEEDSG